MSEYDASGRGHGHRCCIMHELVRRVLFVAAPKPTSRRWPKILRRKIRARLSLYYQTNVSAGVVSERITPSWDYKLQPCRRSGSDEANTTM